MNRGRGVSKNTVARCVYHVASVEVRRRIVWRASPAMPSSRWSVSGASAPAIFSGHSTARHHGVTRKSSSRTILDLAGVFEAVGVEVNQRPFRTAVDVVDRERGAGNRFLDTEAAGEPLDKRGFADAEIAVKGEGGVGRQRASEGFGDGARFFRGSGGEAVAELIDDVHRAERGGISGGVRSRGIRRVARSRAGGGRR